MILTVSLFIYFYPAAPLECPQADLAIWRDPSAQSNLSNPCSSSGSIAANHVCMQSAARLGASAIWPNRRRRRDPFYPRLSVSKYRLIHRLPVHTIYLQQHERHLVSGLRPVLSTADIITPALGRRLYPLITIAEDVETRHGIIWMVSPTVRRRGLDRERSWNAVRCLVDWPVLKR